MTAAERLAYLAGTTGTAAALLLAIGTGATAGTALVDYSGLPTGTAAEHLLAEHADDEEDTGGFWGPAPRTMPSRRPRRRREEPALIALGVM